MRGMELSNEDESVDISVDYDFEPEDVKEGVYRITFSTAGREFKTIRRIIRRKVRRSDDILPRKIFSDVEGGLLV